MGFAENNQLIQMVSERTLIPERLLVRYSLTALLMILLIVTFQSLFTSLFCMVLPMYASLKALTRHDVEGTRLCLNYWVLYAFFSISEIVLYPLIYFIPFWSICKCCIMIWLYSPVTHGGARIMVVLGPIFKTQVEYRIDALIGRVPGFQRLLVFKKLATVASRVREE